MHQNNLHASVLKTILHSIHVFFRFSARMLGYIVSMLICIAVSVYLAYAFIPNLVKDVLDYNHAQEISDTVIREELSAISELATYEFTYANHVDYTDQPQLLGHDVALTDHWFAFDYHGVIKAGFDLEKIEVLWIDSAERTVGIYLPEPTILSNEIFADMSTYEDRNNICNPLEPREVLDYLYTQRGPELEKALNLGLREKAMENAQRLINMVIGAQKYSVIFSK